MKLRTQRSALERAWDKFGETCDHHAWLAPVALILLLALVQALDSMDGVMP